MVSCYSVTQTAWLASRVTQASVSLPAWLPVQADSSCNTALESLLFLSNCPSRLSPGHGTNHFCLFASLTFWGTGSFSRAPDSLPITGYNRSFQSPQSPQEYPPLASPLSNLLSDFTSSDFLLLSGCINPRSMQVFPS